MGPQGCFLAAAGVSLTMTGRELIGTGISELAEGCCLALPYKGFSLCSPNTRATSQMKPHIYLD